MRAGIRKPRADINIRFENDSTRRGVNFVYPCHHRVFMLSVYDTQDVTELLDVMLTIEREIVLYQLFLKKTLIFKESINLYNFLIIIGGPIGIIVGKQILTIFNMFNEEALILNLFYT